MRISDWSSDVCSSDLAAGDIVAIAGLADATVADTICAPEFAAPLEAQPIDPPTLAMTFSVNDSPLAGQEGDKVTSRMIRDRLLRERSEEHTSELQSLMRISYAVFCLKKKKKKQTNNEY